jgi:hypothetical protein
MRDSNPRMPESKSGAFTSLANPQLIGGNGRSRTYTGHRMKVLHYRYATLPK